MSRRFAAASLLAVGLGVLPRLGSAQAPPIQDDPLASQHVLRPPPGYRQPTDTANRGQTYGTSQVPPIQSPRYDGYGLDQGGQSGQAQAQGQTNATASPYGPVETQGYSGSFLGAGGGQLPGSGTPPAPTPYGPTRSAPPNQGYGAGQSAGPPPAYGPVQSVPPNYGANQGGSGVPPLQSPRYERTPGDINANGSATPSYPYPDSGTGTGDSGSQGQIVQEPLAPPTSGSQQTASPSPSGPSPNGPPSSGTPTAGAAAPAGQAVPGQASNGQAAGGQVPNGQAAGGQPGQTPATGSSSPPSSGAPAQVATPQPAPAGTPSGAAPGAPGSSAEASTGFAPPPPPPNIWLPAGVAKLQALDKVNAQASTLSVKVGQTTTFGSLKITVKSCVVRPPDQAADAAAYVDVTDNHPDAEGFSGWLLKDEPSVSMMESPTYDLRVTGCT
ncbi:MAG TPA: DUF2155 domain-containing protein [Rhodopila sp.]|uniref:DUF2155 domain-containing protein n=1 Tax=Rhodopila sp. TaxID=2480087 RepID=UPI002C8C12DF|nr:DUF2155 domain-containing protein [Rhodopila sp.]HVY14261.1 DUF2155 domain-containing protein [Rhodopila sp.]